MKKSSSPKSKTAQKPKTTTKRNVLIPFKLNNKNVYVDVLYTTIRIGAATSKMLHPTYVAMSIDDKAKRRAFRKALHAVCPAAAALSVPSTDVRAAIQNHDDFKWTKVKVSKMTVREDPFFKPTFVGIGCGDENR